MSDSKEQPLADVLDGIKPSDLVNHQLFVIDKINAAAKALRSTERPSVSAGSTINADLVRRLREIADIMEKENRPLDEADLRVIRGSLWELYG